MIKKNPSLPSMKRKIPGFEMAFIEQFYLMAIIRWLLKVQKVIAISAGDGSKEKANLKPET